MFFQQRRRITIGLVAGESSGDILGARLMRAIQKTYIAGIHFVGIGGSYMKAEGMESWYDIEELAVMDVMDIIKRMKRLLKIRRDLLHRFIALPIEVFIGIDSPEFNLTLEYNLKKRGMKILHYVSPSVWAWRKNRLRTIRRSTNNVLLLFPFEKKIYEQSHIPYTFIGHPLADFIPIYPDKLLARKKLGISSTAHCLALLPGSRENEIEMLSTEFLRAADILQNIFPDLEIMVPLVKGHHIHYFKSICSKVTPQLRFRLYSPNYSIPVMTAADATLVASGTATLECMLSKCPMVVGYKMKCITFFIARSFVKIPWISLPNILANQEIVKELLQKNCQYDNLASALIPLLRNRNQHTALLQIFRNIHQDLRNNADEKAAQAVISLIHS
ncbi:lipid-A-disaccharide synthase [Candidatus Schneideria nysicola]|uniref:lipid-A-disaccharide synthase n=1 Tax=Candidatus Schneideria nysicola TaxID=1081631 RepID=UPI001CAA80EE|nr:lipid-A-disaccharide synthase [Candidatus Schneideria nysicola]UAJ64972.1 lipid-A-disaccharide synthase [Candidatus Schneideria nysicola]